MHRATIRHTKIRKEEIEWKEKRTPFPAQEQASTPREIQEGGRRSMDFEKAGDRE